MSDELLPLSISGFVRMKGETSGGPVPNLTWIKIDELVVDSSYQRAIREAGRRNVRRIAEGFRWDMFAPVVVAPVLGGKFALIDGQHRATAAMLCGFAQVPAMVVIADRASQAASFRAINGNVTAISPLQVFHASLAAGEKEAVDLAEVCSCAGVEVMRYPVQARDLTAGQTLALKVLETCFKKFGRETLITALQCVTQTADGHPGSLRAPVIMALCTVLNGNHAWRDAGEPLFDALDDFDFPEVFRAACYADPSERTTVADRIAAQIEKKLDRDLTPKLEGRAA